MGLNQSGRSRWRVVVYRAPAVGALVALVLAGCGVPEAGDKDVIVQRRSAVLSGPTTFNGLGGGAFPPDTIGDIGSGHFGQMTNSTPFQFWDKAGNSFLGPQDVSTLWTRRHARRKGWRSGDRLRSPGRSLAARAVRRLQRQSQQHPGLHLRGDIAHRYTGRDDGGLVRLRLRDAQLPRLSEDRRLAGWVLHDDLRGAQSGAVRARSRQPAERQRRNDRPSPAQPPARSVCAPVSRRCPARCETRVSFRRTSTDPRPQQGQPESSSERWTTSRTARTRPTGSRSTTPRSTGRRRPGRSRSSPT